MRGDLYMPRGGAGSALTRVSCGVWKRPEWRPPDHLKAGPGLAGKVCCALRQQGCRENLGGMSVREGQGKCELGDRFIQPFHKHGWVCSIRGMGTEQCC